MEPASTSRDDVTGSATAMIAQMKISVARKAVKMETSRFVFRREARRFPTTAGSALQRWSMAQTGPSKDGGAGPGSVSMTGSFVTDSVIEI